ncbi:MAG: restriction system protein [Verrucomicrobiota bacterium]
MSPRRRSSIADDLVLLPWWVSVVLAGIVYLVLPAILPPAVAKGGLVGIISLGLVALAAISALRPWKTRHMLEQQTSIESLRALPWKRFEDLLGEAYRRRGYRVQETLGGGADGGVDLVLRKDGRTILVQCKRWKQSVPVQTVRELYGVLIDRGVAGAKLVATTTFTPDAIAFASGKPIELVGSTALLELIRGVQSSGNIAAQPAITEGDHLTPVCPRCGSKMVMRTVRQGANAGKSFWGCSKYPSCRGIRAI